LVVCMLSCVFLIVRRVFKILGIFGHIVLGLDVVVFYVYAVLTCLGYRCGLFFCKK